MIFRLKFLIPLLLGIGALSFGAHLLKNQGVKFLVNRDFLGRFSVKTGEVELKLGRTLELNLSDVGLKDLKKGKRLLGWQNSQASLSAYELGFGKIKINRLSIDSLIINQLEEPESSSSPSSDEVPPSPSGNSNSELGFPKFDFDDIDHRDILERFTGSDKLLSEKKIKDLEKHVKESSEKWRSLLIEDKAFSQNMKKEVSSLDVKWKKEMSDTSVKRDIKILSSDFKMLSSKLDFKNIQEIQRTMKDISNLKKRSQTLISRIQSKKDELKKDQEKLRGLKGKLTSISKQPSSLKGELDLLKGELKDVEVASKQDLEMLKKEINPKNFDAAKITRLLFGKAWEDKLMGYSQKWDMIKEYLPGAGEEDKAQSEPEPSVGRGSYLPVVFKRSPDYADWSISELALSGQVKGSTISFKGLISHLSSDESISGRVPELNLQGSLGEKEGSFDVQGKYSSISNHAEQRWLTFVLKGSQIEKAEFGPPDMRFSLLGGEMNLTVKLDLSKYPTVLGTGEVLVVQSQIQLGENVKQVLKEPLQDALEKVFASAIPFSLTMSPHQKPKLHIGNNLDDLFKGAIKDSLKGYAAQEQNKLKSAFTSRLNQKLKSKFGENSPMSLLAGTQGDISSLIAPLMGKMKGLDLLNSSHQSALGNEGQDAQKLLGGMNSVEERKTQFIQKLKRKLAEEAKNRLKEEAKKRFFDTQKKNSLMKQEQTKKRLEQKAKDKLKEKLKDKFKGFGF